MLQQYQNHANTERGFKLLTSASASILSSFTIFSTILSARGRNIVFERFSSCADIDWRRKDTCFILISSLFALFILSPGQTIIVTLAHN